MGKSVAPYSQVIDVVQARLAPFRRGLRKDDQARLDRLFDLAREQTQAGVLQSDPEPLWPIVLGMLIGMLKELEGRDGKPR